ncbi:hypothetical protein D3C75_1024750 [compost metagenome]
MKINHRIRHQPQILHFALQPDGGIRHACGLAAGKPGPVTVITPRVGVEQILRMSIGIQRFQAAKTAFQYPTFQDSGPLPVGNGIVYGLPPAIDFRHVVTPFLNDEIRLITINFSLCTDVIS